MRTKAHNQILVRRKKRVRAHLQRGTSLCPRISVFRSNSYLYVQFIDDANHVTLVSLNSLNAFPKKKLLTLATAKELGVLAAKRAKEKGIERGIFDRGSYRYHGRIKALAEGLREGGLTF